MPRAIPPPVPRPAHCYRQAHSKSPDPSAGCQTDRRTRPGRASTMRQQHYYCLARLPLEAWVLRFDLEFVTPCSGWLKHEVSIFEAVVHDGFLAVLAQGNLDTGSRFLGDLGQEPVSLRIVALAGVMGAQVLRDL